MLILIYGYNRKCIKKVYTTVVYTIKKSERLKIRIFDLFLAV